MTGGVNCHVSLALLHARLAPQVYVASNVFFACRCSNALSFIRAVGLVADIITAVFDAFLPPTAKVLLVPLVTAIAFVHALGPIERQYPKIASLVAGALRGRTYAFKVWSGGVAVVDDSTHSTRTFRILTLHVARDFNAVHSIDAGYHLLGVVTERVTRVDAVHTVGIDKTSFFLTAILR